MNHKFKIIKLHFSLILVSAILVTFVTACANGVNIGGKATSHWVMLGSRAIEFVGTSGMDAIPVSDKGDYQQIRFKIDGRGTTIQEITITYFDGSQQDMKDINILMAPGQYSKTIILAAKPKRISRIEYKYGAGTEGSGKGMIKIYGYKEVKP